MGSRLDQDLVDHASEQLGEVARRHVREGMGPASAAQAAIRETRSLFPHDWRLGVQGSDEEDFVEVWEIEHKQPSPIARIERAEVEEMARPTRPATRRRSAFSAGFHGGKPRRRRTERA